MKSLKFPNPIFFYILSGGSNRSQYTLVFDENSGLQKIQTPRGHFHGFNLKSSVGLTRFQYQAPWLEGPDLAFELMYNGQGQILRKRMASKGHEHVTYTYDGNDMLKKIMVGETESELGNLFCSLNNCKVNSVQESCAKCFAVHLLKFEIWQIT